MRALLRTLSATALVVVLPLASGVAAQQNRAVDLQKQAQSEFQEVHKTLKELQALRDSANDPELKAEGRLITSGNRFIQEKQINETMALVRELIDDQQYDEALDRMKGLREDIGTLIDLLMNRDLDLQKLLEEIARLEGFKKRVDKLVEEQQEEKDRAAETDALEQHLRELEEAKRQVGQLLDEQKELREETNQQGLAASEEQKAREMSDQQGELKDDAEKLAEKLDKIEKDAKKLGSKPKDGKPGEAKAGEPKEGKPGGGKPGEGSCSGACQGAAQSMGKSQEKLGQNKPESSLKDQDQAIEKLEQALEELEELSEEARRNLLKLPFEQQVRAQEQTQVETDRLAKDMEESEKGDGKAPPKKTPGKKNIQQAVPKQKAAAGQLKEYKPSKAKQDQQDALDELEEAQKKLEDALAQLRQELQDEVLRALEERFAAMLARQKELSARTRAADRLRQNSLVAEGTVPAEVAKRCTEVGNGELELAGEAGDALKLLEEDGSTAVFPVIVGELRDDFNLVGERLHGNKCAKVTQGMQKDIEETLKELLDALRREIEMGEGECGSCNGQPPLVPQSAELKLVLGKQKRVNKRTKQYDAAIPEQMRVTDEAKDEAVEISRKQGKVEDLMRRLATKLSKENNPAGGEDK